MHKCVGAKRTGFLLLRSKLVRTSLIPASAWSFCTFSGIDGDVLRNSFRPPMMLTETRQGLFFFGEGVGFPPVFGYYRCEPEGRASWSSCTCHSFVSGNCGHTSPEESVAL